MRYGHRVYRKRAADQLCRDCGPWTLASWLVGIAAGLATVTAWVAAANPLIHVLALAMVVLALAALRALQSRGKQPVWYALILVAISPIGVLAGGLVRLRMLGIL